MSGALIPYPSREVRPQCFSEHRRQIDLEWPSRTHCYKTARVPNSSESFIHHKPPMAWCHGSLYGLWWKSCWKTWWQIWLSWLWCCWWQGKNNDVACISSSWVHTRKQKSANHEVALSSMSNGEGGFWCVISCLSYVSMSDVWWWRWGVRTHHTWDDLISFLSWCQPCFWINIGHSCWILSSSSSTIMVAAWALQLPVRSHFMDAQIEGWAHWNRWLLMVDQKLTIGLMLITTGGCLLGWIL